ncbi:SDR family NAD(P)-dependent oxidoreductase [Acidimangrovimonas pyrenivorans]|uniref:SDR family NAD(P)-dependent oxidoreductase n=1 Tax=Acidimangrovimonas pyrenivorans TaxID=2030798 RepID=A0ABV7AKS5_9RHOB
MSKTAVITGGAGNLGQALCAELVERGWQVQLIDLPSLALAAAEGPKVSAFACDLTNPAQVKSACARIAAASPAIDLVIYNAGVTQVAGFAESSLDSHRRVFEINYFGAVSVAKELLGAVRLARGTHLAMSSVAGFTPLFHRTAYSASKHALEGFFKSLRTEEERHGVSCLIAAPSFIANDPAPGADPDGLLRPGSTGDNIDAMSAAEAARIVLSGYDRRAPMTPVGRIARLAWWVNRLSPGFYETQMKKRIHGA